MAALDLLARAICPPGTYYRNGNCYRKSGWYYWGRWVLAGIIILITLIAIVSCCMRSRRQRKQGLRPMYGTGWMAPPNKFGGQQQGQQQWAGGQPPPPPYGGQNQYQQNQYPPGFGTGYGPPAPPRDYYGGQADGVQQPQNAYQPVYSPPAGPPPGK